MTRTNRAAADRRKSGRLAVVSDSDRRLQVLRNSLSDPNVNTAEVLRSIGRSEMEQMRYGEAAATYEELIDLDSADLRSQALLARCLEKLGRWGEAAARFQLVLGFEPDNMEALLGLGLCMMREDVPSRALGAFERCLQIKSDQVVALLGKAVCLQLMGNPAEAAVAYRELLRVQPEIESALEYLIQGPSAQGQTPASAAPSAADVLEGIISAALASGNYTLTAKHCTQLTDQVPDHYGAWFNLGVAEQHNGRADQAIAAFRRAVQLRPESPEPMQALAMALHCKGNLMEAETCYSAWLAVAPNASAALWNLALVVEDSGRCAEAGELYRRLTEADPDHAEAWFRLGVTRSRLSEHALAAEAYRRCLSLTPDCVEAHFNLGMSCGTLGHLDEARRAFEEALRRRTGLTPALRGLATLAVRSGDATLALGLHRELMALGDPTPEIAENLAVLEHRPARVNVPQESYRQPAPAGSPGGRIDLSVPEPALWKGGA